MSYSPGQGFGAGAFSPQGLAQDPRLVMAQALMAQGQSEAPVQSGVQGIARALTGAIGGYQGGQARQAQIQAMNQANAAMSDPSEPNQLKRLQNASAIHQQLNPYAPDPYQQAVIGMMTRPPEKLGAGDRLAQVNPASGQYEQVMAGGPQSTQGKLLADFNSTPPGPGKDFMFGQLIKEGLVSERDTMLIGQDGKAMPWGAGVPAYIREASGARAGGAAQAVQPFEQQNKAFQANLDIGVAKAVPHDVAPGATVAPYNALAGQPDSLPAPMGAPGQPQAQGAPPAPAPAQGAPAAAPPAPGPQSGVPDMSQSMAPGQQPPMVTQNRPGVFTNTNMPPGFNPGMGMSGSLAGVEDLAKMDAKEVARQGEMVPGLRENQAQIALIQDLAQRTKTGWGMDTVAQGTKVLQSVFGLSGDKLKEWTGVNPSDADALNKTFLKLSADAVRSMGAREPGSVISMFAKAFPNLETTPEALQLMTHVLDADARYKIDRANAIREHYQGEINSARQGGPYNGLLKFDQSFHQDHDPRMYLAGAQAEVGDKAAWARYSKDQDITRVVSLIPQGTRFLAPDGTWVVKQ